MCSWLFSGLQCVLLLSAALCVPAAAVSLRTHTQVCSRVFGAASGLVDMLVAHIPSSKVATANKVARLYTGPQDPNSQLIQFMTGCSRSGQRAAVRGRGTFCERMIVMGYAPCLTCGVCCMFGPPLCFKKDG
jgi:hypothetical protein